MFKTRYLLIAAALLSAGIPCSIHAQGTVTLMEVDGDVYLTTNYGSRADFVVESFGNGLRVRGVNGTEVIVNDWENLQQTNVGPFRSFSTPTNLHIDAIYNGSSGEVGSNVYVGSQFDQIFLPGNLSISGRQVKLYSLFAGGNINVGTTSRLTVNAISAYHTSLSGPRVQADGVVSDGNLTVSGRYGASNDIRLSNCMTRNQLNVFGSYRSDTISLDTMIGGGPFYSPVNEIYVNMSSGGDNLILRSSFFNRLKLYGGSGSDIFTNPGGNSGSMRFNSVETFN